MIVVRFLFIPDSTGVPVPPKIRVSWHQRRQADELDKVPEIHAGER